MKAKPNKPRKPQTPKPTRYEYQTLLMVNVADVAGLNALAHDGWRVVAVSSQGETLVTLLERAKEP